MDYTPLSERCRAELLEALGADDSMRVAGWLDLLLPHYDPGPSASELTRAKADATRALNRFVSCVDRHPQIQHALSHWQSVRNYVESLIHQLNHEPFEITVRDVIDGKPVEPKRKAKPGRPKVDKRRDVVGGIVAFAFQLARVRATRGRRGEFGKACIAICREVLGVEPPKEFDQATLDQFLRRGAHHWADVRLRDLRARSEQQQDDAIAHITIRTSEVGKKPPPL